METTVNESRDRAAIIETVDNVARGADLRQWNTVEAAFAGRVVLDYGSPDLLTPREIVGRWKPLLSAFDSTQHALRDVQVTFLERDRARVTSTFQATHHLEGVPGGALWILDGRYQHELVRTEAGWRISRMRMIPGASSGNPTLLGAARAQAHVADPAPSRVAVEHVSFSSEGEAVVGVLRVPANRRAGARLPAVVVLGSWTTVKEQMPALYAERLAAAGFAALTIDFRGFGESAGAPRGYESPQRKIQDIRAAVGFLTARDGIDPAGVGLIGVCASSGYVAAEAADDPRVKSVVLIAPWLHDAALVEQVYGSRAAYGGTGVQALTAAGRTARSKYDREGVVDSVPGASSTDSRAAMYSPDPKVLDYYLNVQRGGTPQWGNRFAVLSWPEWLEFDALASAPRLHAPTLIVHSEQGAIPDGARRFAQAMPRPPKMIWTTGTQFHFYDDAPTIDRATQAALDHLRATMGTGSASSADEREVNRRAVRSFFESLEAKNIEAFMAVWADDGVQTMPFSPAGFPTRLDGKAAIRRQYGDLPRNFKSMRFPDLEIHDLADPRGFFVTYRGEIELAKGGRYDNAYAGHFVVEHGKVREFREYFNPQILERAFGAELQKNFNVKK